MNLRYIAVCAAFPLIGCISVHDTRTVEQQQSDLRDATQTLVGTYDVVDSRHNNLNFTSVEVRAPVSSNGPNVKMMNGASQYAVLHGSKKCRGYVVKGRPHAAVMCDDPASGINFYTLDLITQNETVKDGGVIKSFPDMTVSPGHLLLEYSENMNGRTHYLVLAKKTVE